MCWGRFSPSCLLYASCLTEPGSSTWRWSPWCLKTPSSRSATLRTSPPRTPSSGTAPSWPACSTTRVRRNAGGGAGQVEGEALLRVFPSSFALCWIIITGCKGYWPLRFIWRILIVCFRFGPDSEMAFLTTSSFCLPLSMKWTLCLWPASLL